MWDVDGKVRGGDEQLLAAVTKGREKTTTTKVRSRRRGRRNHDNGDEGGERNGVVVVGLGGCNSVREEIEGLGRRKKISDW